MLYTKVKTIEGVEYLCWDYNIIKPHLILPMVLKQSEKWLFGKNNEPNVFIPLSNIKGRLGVGNQYNDYGRFEDKFTIALLRTVPFPGDSDEVRIKIYRTPIDIILILRHYEEILGVYAQTLSETPTQKLTMEFEE